MASSTMSQWGNDLYTGKRSYDIVGNRSRWFAVSLGLILLSVVLLLVLRLNPGIAFRGGSEFTVPGVSDTSQQPAVDAVSAVSGAEVPRVSVVGTDTLRVQTSELDDAQTNELAVSLAVAYGVDPADVGSSYVGPAWGADVTGKALDRKSVV